jgi:hypothetical protein
MANTIDSIIDQIPTDALTGPAAEALGRKSGSTSNNSGAAASDALGAAASDALGSTSGAEATAGQPNPDEEGIYIPPEERTPTLEARDVNKETTGEPTSGEPTSGGSRRTYKRKGGKRKQKRRKSHKKKRNSHKRR